MTTKSELTVDHHPQVFDGELRGDNAIASPNHHLLLRLLVVQNNHSNFVVSQIQLREALCIV